MKYIESFQGGETSFWDIFQYFKDIPIFKSIYKEDRSRDKNKSSKLMWYLVLTKDIDSEFYSLDDEEKHGQIVGVLDFNPLEFLDSREKLDLLLNAFENFIDTVITADIRALEQKLIERKKFIISTKYTLDEMVYPEDGRPYLKKGTASQLDKMLVDTKDIHEEIRKLRAAASSEQIEKGRGGKTSSFIED